MDARHLFASIAQRTAQESGRPWVFLLAVASVVAWALTGPLFAFSETWQLVINTGTTIVTFLMVFLIQHTQNADTAAIHLKLDELIRATREADNILLDMEEMDERELEAIRKRYEALADMARRKQEPRGASPCRDGD